MKKRLALHVLVSILTFALGLAAARLSPSRDTSRSVMPPSRFIPAGEEAVDDVGEEAADDEEIIETSFRYQLTTQPLVDSEKHQYFLSHTGSTEQDSLIVAELAREGFNVSPLAALSDTVGSRDYDPKKGSALIVRIGQINRLNNGEVVVGSFLHAWWSGWRAAYVLRLRHAEDGRWRVVEREELTR